MEVNRYTELTPSQFNPLSVQEIMMVPLAKQKKHDETLDFLGQVGGVDAQVHEVDRPGVNAKLDEFKQRSMQLEDTIMNQGIGNTRTIAKEIVKLKRDAVNAFSSSGEIGRSINLYKTYEENRKKILENNKMNPQHQQALLNKLNQDYAATEGIFKNPNATWNSNYGWESINEQDKAIELGEKINDQVYKNMSPITDSKGNVVGYSYQGYEYRQGEDGHMYWIKDGYSSRTLPKSVLLNKIVPALSNDPDIQSQVQSLVSVGILKDEKDIERYIGNAAMNAANLLEKREFTYDQQMRNPIDGDGSGSGDFTNPSWDIMTNPVPDMLTDKIINPIKYSLDFQQHIPRWETNEEYEKRTGKKFVRSPKGGTGDKIRVDDPTQYDKKALQKSKEDFFKREPLIKDIYENAGKYMFGDDFDMYNNEQFEQIRERIETNNDKYGSANLTNLIIKPMDNDAIMEFIPSGYKGKYDEYALRLQDNASYMDEQGNYYKNINDAKEKLNLRFAGEDNGMNPRMMGALTWDNNLPLLTAGKEANKHVDEFTEAIVTIYSNEDGEEIKLFASRPKGDKSRTPEQKQRFKTIREKINKARLSVDIPIEVNLPVNGKDEKVKLRAIPADMLVDRKIKNQVLKNFTSAQVNQNDDMDSESFTQLFNNSTKKGNELIQNIGGDNEIEIITNLKALFDNAYITGNTSAQEALDEIIPDEDSQMNMYEMFNMYSEAVSNPKSEFYQLDFDDESIPQFINRETLYNIVAKGGIRNQ